MFKTFLTPSTSEREALGSADLSCLLQGQGDGDRQVCATVYFSLQVSNVSMNYCCCCLPCDHRDKCAGNREETVFFGLW